MAINSIGQDLAKYGEYKPSEVVEDKSVLGKDDFMMLLLTELQHQDPTEPTDTAAVLTQTSQLATLEASENTNKALSDLSATLAMGDQFSTIAAIGKTADLGSNAISYEEGSISSFEVYFPSDIKTGTLNIKDMQGNSVATLNIEANSAGVHQFDWDGKNMSGNFAEPGLYKIDANYNNADGESLTTKLGAYPIESIKFDSGKALVKVGSNYVPIENIKEIY